MEKKENRKQKSTLRNVLEWIMTFVAAVVIALPVRAFAFELVRVDGISMQHTLADGEIMLVSKYDYSTTWFTLPWQDDRTKENAARLTFGGDPRRFDVVVCRYPGRGDTNFVKRVVGIPGDVVEIREGYLYVNGTMYEEEYITDEFRVRGGSNGLNYGPCTVPDGQYFVMGDHRNNSNDSRAQGCIGRDMIVGHVRSVVYPFGEIRGVQ